VGCIILKWFLNTYGGIAWTGIHLARDRDKWRALVNTAVNLLVSREEFIDQMTHC
jgi:hypothetical protein